MSIDPRRFGVGLWVVWIAASALGGALATLLPLAGIADLVNRSSSHDFLVAYAALFAGIAAVCQAIVLVFVAPRRGAALFWVPATVVGAALLYGQRDQLLAALINSFGGNIYAGGTMSPIVEAAFDALYPLAFGLAQGLVLTLVTRRKAALGIWVVGNLLALPATHHFAYLSLGGGTRGTTFIELHALFYGVYAW